MVSQNWTWVWDVIYSPFGATAAIFDATTKLDARFPGQWFQLETGLAYNWHRHYDASLGRYVQPDPLRVDETEGAVVGGVTPAVLQPKATLVDQINAQSGAMKFGAAEGVTGAFSSKRGNFPDGPSLYGYSTQNPLAKIDPKGLFTTSPRLPYTPIQKQNCAANDNIPKGRCQGTVLSVDSFNVVSCFYRYHSGMTFSNNWGSFFQGSPFCVDVVE